MKRKISLLKGLSAILIMLAILFISFAFYKSCQEMPKSNTEIHVYINENDSVVDQLQKSVTELTKLLEGVQDDSMVISIERVKREKCK